MTWPCWPPIPQVNQSPWVTTVDQPRSNLQVYKDSSTAFHTRLVRSQIPSSQYSQAYKLKTSVNISNLPLNKIVFEQVSIMATRNRSGRWARLHEANLDESDVSDSSTPAFAPRNLDNTVREDANAAFGAQVADRTPQTSRPVAEEPPSAQEVPQHREEATMNGHLHDQENRGPVSPLQFRHFAPYEAAGAFVDNERGNIPPPEYVAQTEAGSTSVYPQGASDFEMPNVGYRFDHSQPLGMMRMPTAAELNQDLMSRRGFMLVPVEMRPVHHYSTPFAPVPPLYPVPVPVSNPMPTRGFHFDSATGVYTSYEPVHPNLQPPPHIIRVNEPAHFNFQPPAPPPHIIGANGPVHFTPVPMLPHAIRVVNGPARRADSEPSHRHRDPAENPFQRQEEELERARRRNEVRIAALAQEQRQAENPGRVHNRWASGTGSPSSARLHGQPRRSRR